MSVQPDDVVTAQRGCNSGATACRDLAVGSRATATWEALQMFEVKEMRKERKKLTVDADQPGVQTRAECCTCAHQNPIRVLRCELTISLRQNMHICMQSP